MAALLTITAKEISLTNQDWRAFGVWVAIVARQTRTEWNVVRYAAKSVNATRRWTWILAPFVLANLVA